MAGLHCGRLCARAMGACWGVVGARAGFYSAAKGCMVDYAGGDWARVC